MLIAEAQKSESKNLTGTKTQVRQKDGDPSDKFAKQSGMNELREKQQGS